MVLGEEWLPVQKEEQFLDSPGNHNKFLLVVVGVDLGKLLEINFPYFCDDFAGLLGLFGQVEGDSDGREVQVGGELAANMVMFFDE